MSAWIVSDAHIDALITYAHSGGYDRVNRPETETELGQILVNENYRSVNARYRNEYGEPHRYTFKPYIDKPLKPVVVIKLCNCFDYQACETDDYPKTPAAHIVESIRDRAISNLPGYDDAPWGLDPDERCENVVLLSDLIGQVG